MPVKGSILLYPNRDYVFGPKFYKENLVEKKGVELTYKQCKEILDHSSRIIGDVITNEVDGFKLPHGFGYISPVKYEADRPAVNWDATRKLNTGKHVYHTNMHTDGYSCKVSWFRIGRVEQAHFHEVFKFKSFRTLSKKVSEAFINGVNYVEWKIPDFIEKGRLENLYNKKFRKELKQ